MSSRLKNVLKKEDPKNPYTDDQIAQLLGVSREKITEERMRYDIPDSRERRKAVLLGDALQILREQPGISERQFCKQLCDLGYNISRHIASHLKNEILQEGKVLEQKDQALDNAQLEQAEDKVYATFQDIVGHEGSLRAQISQAKAAVLYPPYGLHTLILGPTGTGKSQLAETMYNYAVDEGTFEENAPLVMLNCAEYADNPQRLLARLFGQEKGAFPGAEVSKAGLVEKANGGILFLDEIHCLPKEGQENLYSLLEQGTYHRLGERENSRTSKVLLIGATTENPEEKLLLALRRRIPVVIAMPALRDRPLAEVYEMIRGFFRIEAVRMGKSLCVKPEALKALLGYEYLGNAGQLRGDIQVACARSLLRYMGQKAGTVAIDLQDMPEHLQIDSYNSHPEISKWFNAELKLELPDITAVAPKEGRYILPADVYRCIEKEFLELEKKGLAHSEIKRVVGAQLEQALRNFMKFVHTLTHQGHEEAKVGVVVITHGHVARGMADAANELLGVEHAVGVEFALGKQFADVLDEVAEVVQNVDQGKGCLLLVDMGPLLMLGEAVSKRTGIATRTVGRVDTVKVLEAVRRAIAHDADLAEIAECLANDRVQPDKRELPTLPKPKALLAIDMAGQGTAGRLKQYIENLLPEISSYIQILAVDARQHSVNKQIALLQQDYELVACMGATQPPNSKLPFIAMAEILSGTGLGKIEEVAGLSKMQLSPWRRLTEEVLEEELIFCQLQVEDKNDAIDYLVDSLEKKGYVEPGFLLSVYKREALGHSMLENQVAIPRGDTKYVTKSAVVIATLAQPVEWQNDVNTEMVFLFALQQDTAWVDALHDVMTSPRYCKELMRAEEASQVIDLIHHAQYMGPWESIGEAAAAKEQY